MSRWPGDIDDDKGAPRAASPGQPGGDDRGLVARWISGIGSALLLAWGGYAYLNAVAGGTGGGISLAFLLILPATLSLFLGLLLGRGRDWRFRHYAAIPILLTVVALLIGALVLQEGVICLVMLAPLWLIAALSGAGLAYALRPRPVADIDRMRDTFRIHALLVIPIAALAIEPQLTPPTEIVTVTSSRTVAADPATLWPVLVSIPAIAPDEGVGNLTHEWLGVPRPIAAQLVGTGVGAVRHARWGDGIRFEEHVTAWDPDRALSWRFVFPDRSIEHRVDRHISPRGAHLSVLAGGYRLVPLTGGRTRVELWTRYRLATPVNGYARLWGRHLLGDIQDNILAIIAGRVSRPD